MSEQAPIRLLSRADLETLGIIYSNVHMLRLEQEGIMPKRVYLSPGRVAWVEAEVQIYLAKCLEARSHRLHPGDLPMRIKRQKLKM